MAAADVRFTPAGKAVASFTVAVNERRFDKHDERVGGRRHHVLPVLGVGADGRELR